MRGHPHSAAGLGGESGHLGLLASLSRLSAMRASQGWGAPRWEIEWPVLPALVQTRAQTPQLWVLAASEAFVTLSTAWQLTGGRRDRSHISTDSLYGSLCSKPWLAHL